MAVKGVEGSSQITLLCYLAGVFIFKGVMGEIGCTLRIEITQMIS